MKVAWRRGSCTAQEVIEALVDRGWSDGTVKTLLNRLHTKGALRFEKHGKSYVYYPALREDDLRSTEVESFVLRVFDGAVSPMIAHFANTRRLSERDLDELERILRERRNRK